MKDYWAIFNYEVYMLLHTIYLAENYNNPLDVMQLTIKNALVESRFFHIRILVEILLSRNKQFKDDLTLENLINKKIQSDSLKKLLVELNSIYGTSKQENSPCWTINKMLAHASSLRGSSYDYSEIFNKLFPVILNILKEIYILSQNGKLKEHLSFAEKYL